METYHRNSTQVDARNAAWAETGEEIQEKFNTVPTCEAAARFSGYPFRE